MKKIWILIVLAGFSLVLSGCGGSEEIADEAHQSAPVRVSVEEVSADRGADEVELVGTVKAVVTTTVSSQTTGRILSTHFEEGDRIKTGDVMAEIDPRQARAGAAQAEAGLREARMALREVKRGRQAAEAGLEMAQANAGVAEATYERFKALLERESVSQQEFDEVEARYLSSQAAVEQAQQSVLALEEKQAQVEARIDQAEAGLEQAKLNLGYTEVEAPYAGVVVQKMAQAGQLASPGIPLYTVEKSDYELHVSIDLERSGSVSRGDEIPVYFDHIGEPLTGRVKDVLPVADPVTRTVLIKISLPTHPAVYSGVFGRAFFQTDGPASLSVPASSLVRRGQLTGVFVVDDQSVARYRLVRIGEESGSRIEILSGLNTGETVVTDPAQVAEGSIVEIS